MERDVAKIPGKRGMRKTAKYTLEIALMADGVAPNDVYKTLATEAGVERAFKKLDQLKPNLVWWEKGSQPPQLLASGEVTMTDRWLGRFLDKMEELDLFDNTLLILLSDWPRPMRRTRRTSRSCGRTTFIRSTRG